MSPQKLSEAIAAGCRHLPLQLDDAQLQQLSQLLTELERWNARTNLTAIRNINDMVSGHILDSLAVEPYLRGERIIDIGTGPGFPGLPLAISKVKSAVATVPSPQTSKKLSTL